MHEPCDRRTLLKKGAALAVMAGVATPSAMLANPSSRERIDVHGHIPPEGLSLEEILRLMDEAGISKTVLMPRGPIPQGAALDLFREAPDRIIPFLGTMTAAWHRGDYDTLKRAEKSLATGLFKGVGELMVRYFGNERLGEMDVNRAADSGFILDLADICAAFNCVIQVHMEPERENIESMERLLAAKPKTNVIWAHFGSVSNRGFAQFAPLYRSDKPYFLDAFLQRYPNLYTDISGIQDTNRTFSKGYNLRRPMPWFDDTGKLLPVFYECIQRNQLKILWGLDTPYLQNWSPKPMKLWVASDERLLQQFPSQELRDNIMFRNAKRLLGV